MPDGHAPRDLGRLFRPRSVAVLGGVWAGNLVTQLRKAGFPGEIWPVHPTRKEIAGVSCRPSLEDLPGAPDAAFVGVNREASVSAVQRLAAMGAGGAVCFAAGYRETGTPEGALLQDRLVAAAGAMPLVGPNCYGVLNMLDRVALWPDQHGLVPVDAGVAIVGQSSNVAINLTMQRRGLPIALVAMAGNQAQTGLADLALAALDDPRVTALGLHIEGFGDLAAFEAMAARARALRKPVVVLKSGRSEAARAATLSHTASLAGAAAVSSAFLARLGLTEVASLGALLEALKLLHMGGPLAGPDVVSVSCSGGEASLMADGALGTAIRWMPFPEATRAALAEGLGPLVALRNPLDYNTFVWGDEPRMAATFATAMEAGADLSAFVLDLPRPDRCDRAGYACAVGAIRAARAATGARAVVVASLPETLDEAATAVFEADGIAVLHGLDDALAAIDATIRAGRPVAAPDPALARGAPGPVITLSEAEAKAALAAHGLRVPAAVTAADPDGIVAAAGALRFPLALKTLGVAHKTDAGALALGLADAAALRAAADRLAPLGAGLLVEEMVAPGVELLVGVLRDASGLVALTVGAGGILTELWADATTLILPATRDEVRAALASLRGAPRLAGYRGQPGADMDAVLDAIEAIARYAAAEPRLVELDVNPLICGPDSAVAVDALITLEAP